MRGYEKRQKDVLFSECILEYAVQLIIKSTATVSGYPPPSKWQIYRNPSDRSVLHFILGGINDFFL
jgi:hypothetical protein